MKKKLLEKPEMTIILFDDTDIIAASGCGGDTSGNGVQQSENGEGPEE